MNAPPGSPTWDGLVHDHDHPADGTGRDPLAIHCGPDDIVHLISHDGSTRKRDFYHRRTGIGAWATEVLVFDGVANSNTDVQRGSSGPCVNVIGMGNDRVAIALNLTTGSGQLQPEGAHVAVWWSDDTGATWTGPNLIYTDVDNGNATYPLLAFNPIEQLILSYYKMHSLLDRTLGFFHSDDYGETWVDDGLPAALDTVNWPGGQSYGFILRGAFMYAAELFGIGNPRDYTVWRAPTADLTTWTQIYTCTHDADLLYTMGGDLPGGLDYYHFFDVASYVVPGTRSAHILVAPEVFEEPDVTPPPCIVVPIAVYVIGEDGTATMCGPQFLPPFDAAYSYLWTGPGGFTSTDRCVTVSVPGTYNLTVTNLINGIPSFCTGTVVSIPPLPPSTEVQKGKPFRRGDLPLEASGHPAGNPTIKRVGD